MTNLTPEQRVKWALDQYKTYRERARRGIILLAITIVLIFLAEIISILVSNPLTIRYFLTGLFGISSLVTLFFASSSRNKSLEYYLPEIEDRLLAFLKPATDALTTYVAYSRPDDKEKAFVNLKKVADLLDKWYPGNLAFVKDGKVGAMLDSLQTNFRYGLLSALKDANPAQIGNIPLTVENMEQTLEGTPKISEYILENWSKNVTEFKPPELPEPFWRKIPTKKSHIVKGSVAVIGTAVVGVIGFYINAEAGYLGTISTAAIMVLILLSTREKRGRGG